jgi:hypothetical protein
VPKIAEINTVCREIDRENVYYEPEIVTDVQSDGRKLSRVVVCVYQDRNNRDSKGTIPLDTFIDKIYFDVKDLYEEAEGFPGKYDKENDGETFGWALTDSWHHLGNVYYFLLSVFNLIDTTKDSSPIIDTKGSIQGKMNYTITFEIYDVDKKTKLNPLEFETLNELIGKNLKLIVELRKCTELPEKYCWKVMCKYQYADQVYETKICERMKEPHFDYCAHHMSVITDDMIQHLMYNTLTVGVYGMIESKRSRKQEKLQEEEREFQETLQRLKTKQRF